VKIVTILVRITQIMLVASFFAMLFLLRNAEFNHINDLSPDKFDVRTMFYSLITIGGDTITVALALCLELLLRIYKGQTK